MSESFYQLSLNIVNSKYAESSAIDFNNISDYASSEWELKQRYWLFAAVVLGTLWFWDFSLL